jgi:hypothetical protein
MQGSPRGGTPGYRHRSMQPIGTLGHLLENPAWTAGATILAAVAIGVSIYLTRRSRSKKILSYRVSVTELVSVHGDAKDKIEISYEGETVENVHLVEVGLRNAGNVPIVRSDFEVPISIALGEGSEVLSAEVSGAEPSELSPDLEVAKGEGRPGTGSTRSSEGEESVTEVSLEPALLNPGDRLTIKILVSDLVGAPDLDYRIVGVRTLTDDADPKARSWRTKVDENGLAWFVALAIILLAGFIGFAIGRPGKDQSQVHLLGGESRCGKILRSGPGQLILQEAGDGRVRRFPIDHVISIDDNRC